MGRAERRRAEREQAKSHKTINISPAEIKRLAHEAVDKGLEIQRNELINEIVHDYSIVVAMVAHDKLGFGPKRLEKFLADIVDLWDSIDMDYVKITELEDVIFEETGINMKGARKDDQNS